jgi:class 3 adenylate cyclase
VRIGIHAGQAMGRDGDVIGQMVNVAARVADAAGPGEVLVTEPVADHTGGGVRFDDRGLQELKGVPEPRHVLALRTGD